MLRSPRKDAPSYRAKDDEDSSAGILLERPFPIREFRGLKPMTASYTLIARRGTIIIYSRFPGMNMARVMIVKEGEAWKEGEIWNAFPTTVLIESNGKKVLVDPGNHPSLLEFLERRSVWKEDIDMIFATHHHPDHIMNIGWFPGVPVLDGEYVYEGTRISPHNGRIPGTDIEVIPTPGHSPEHASLLVRSPEASWLICGDLIWWTRDDVPIPDREWFMEHSDEFAEDPEQLARSREMVLSLGADIHIPGHGKPFLSFENLNRSGR